MSDLLRKTDNMLRIGEVVEVNLSALPPMVRVEVDEGVPSDWMPYAMPFVGQTSFWTAAKKGVKGLIVSEGGENRINRFHPAYYDGGNAPSGLTEDDFMIFFKNGDTIHHDSNAGTITLNIDKLTVVNTEQAEINSKTVDINAPKITLNGDVLITQTLTVQGFASLNGGFAMNSGASRNVFFQALQTNYSAINSDIWRRPVTGTINIPIIVNNVMTYNVDPILHGIPYLDHKHKGVLVGGATTEGVV